MTGEECLRNAFVSLEVNESYSEAVLGMSDHSRLVFCHRVGERWVRAEGPDANVNQTTQAATILARIAMFRLNGKHLDIQFIDASKWEAQFRAVPEKLLPDDPPKKSLSG